MHPTFIEQLAAEHRRELVAEASAHGHGRHHPRPGTDVRSLSGASTWWGRLRLRAFASAAEPLGTSPVSVHTPVAATH